MGTSTILPSADQFTGNLKSISPNSPSMSRSVSASGSPRSSILPRMSVGSLLNDELHNENEDGDNGAQMQSDDQKVVNMLSLTTQASHAKLRPVPLASHPHHSSPPAQTSSRPTPDESQAGDTSISSPKKRNRWRDEDEEEIEYLGRTPAIWRKWESAGGVRSEKGSPYCYAYDDAGQRTSLLHRIAAQLS